MKLDADWITKIAQQTAQAEDALKGGGVFTHRAHRLLSASVAKTQPALTVPGYVRFTPAQQPALQQALRASAVGSQGRVGAAAGYFARAKRR